MSARGGWGMRHGEKNDSCHPHPVNDRMVELLPMLRGYARMLTRDASEADDLLQEGLARAIAHIDQFEPGTNLKAWLFTIVRNAHFTAVRKRSREQHMRANVPAERAAVWGGQGWSLSAQRVRRALDEMPREQKDVILLVCGAGVSYEEAAQITGSAVGTVKSRISRGRQRLAKLLGIDSVDDLAGDSAGHVLPPIGEAYDDS